MSDTLLDAARHAASWCCARSEAMTTTKTEGHRMLLAKIASTPGCRWFVHRDGTTYYNHGFRTKAAADEWIDAHRRADLMEWRRGYRFRLRDDTHDVVIVDRHGEPAIWGRPVEPTRRRR